MCLFEMLELTTTYFKYDDKYKNMGSPLSTVVANLYMESFENQAIEMASVKPILWLRYADDTFIMWPSGIGTVPATGEQH